jgi:hypothetical protein
MHICNTLRPCNQFHTFLTTLKQLLIHLLTYLLTHGAESFLRSRRLCSHSRIYHHLWNPKVQYRVHKNPPLVPVLNHIDPIHNIPSYHAKIHFNIVHPPTSSSSQWFLSVWISHQYAICIHF